MVSRKRPGVTFWIMPLVIGLVGFYRVAQSPSYAVYRTVDIVQLLASAVCFGMTMVGLISLLRGTRP